MKTKKTTVYAQKLHSGNVAISSKNGDDYYGTFIHNYPDCPKKLSRFITINGVSYILKWHPDYDGPIGK